MPFQGRSAGQNAFRGSKESSVAAWLWHKLGIFFSEFLHSKLFSLFYRSNFHFLPNSQLIKDD